MSIPANAIRADRAYVADAPDAPLRMITVRDGVPSYVDLDERHALAMAEDLIAAARRRLDARGQG